MSTDRFEEGLRREIDEGVRALETRTEQRRLRLAEAEAAADAARELLDHSDTDQHSAAWIEADRRATVARTRLEVSEERLKAARRRQTAKATAKQIAKAVELESTIDSHANRIAAHLDKLDSVARDIVEIIQAIEGESTATHRAIADLARAREALGLPRVNRGVADPAHGFNVRLLAAIRATGHHAYQLERWLRPWAYFSSDNGRSHTASAPVAP